MTKILTTAVSILLSAITFLSVTLMGWFGYAKIKVNFDEIIGEMLPIHNIGRMPEYEPGSDANKYFAEANMTSCRTHDIGMTDMYKIFPDFSRDADDETAYDFADCDKVIASIRAAGMEPFFRLGISYSDPEQQKELLTPPSDFHKWAEICEHIILHYNYGWADGFSYGIEYWEIWNEPDNDEDLSQNHFWLGTAEEFCELYDTAATYLKQKFPEIKIGGYGSCGFYALTRTNAVNTGSSPRNQYFISFFEIFLDYIEEHNTPMDFFSWHSYTTTDKNEQYIKYVRKSLGRAGYGDAEIICNEWNYNPAENDKLDRRYGANQTSMLLMFQNAGLDMAHYYCAAADYALHSGMFVPDKKPSSAYYGFWAFGQLFKMKNQVEISGSMPKDMYAVAASDGKSAGLLIANVSERRGRRLNIVSEYELDKCYTVNDNCEWVQTELPERISSGSILYVTFVPRKKSTSEEVLWSGQWESNPPLKLGKLSFYR